MKFYSRVAESLLERSGPFTDEELIQLAQPFIVGEVSIELARQVLTSAAWDALAAVHGKELANRIKREVK